MTQPGTPTTPTLTTEDMVAELWDRQQIGDVMLRFGRGLDLHDWASGTARRDRDRP